MICRNMKINGRRTSLRMEPDMWDALEHVASLQGLKVAALVSEIDATRGESNTTAAVRIYVLRYYREALREALEIEDIRSTLPMMPDLRPGPVAAQY